jgi:hypothetical protein
MIKQVSSIFVFIVIALLMIGLWIASIIFVYWDTDRRQISGRVQLAWLLIAAILPILGGIIYMFFRTKLHPSQPRSRTLPYHQDRPTPLKRPTGIDLQMPTIPATDQIESTLPATAALTPVLSQVNKAKKVYELQALEGPHTGQVFALLQLPVNIGRGSRAKIQLNADLGVSRQHAEIYERSGELRIRDLKSSHGTNVNGFGILDRALSPGDEIRIGATTLVLRSGGGNGR